MTVVGVQSDWSPWLARLQAMPAGTRRSRELAEMVDSRLGDYEQRNRQSVEELADQLGLPHPPADDEQQQVARQNALGNLQDALERQANLTPSYSGELISIGWRNALLADLGRSLLNLGPAGLLQVARASGTDQQLRRLRSDYRDQQLLQALRHFTVWFRLLAAHRRGEPAGEVLWELLSKQLHGQLR